MADPVMLKDYPAQSQRAAICHAQWRENMEESMDTIETFAAMNGRVLHSAGIVSDVSVITEGEAKGHEMFIDGETLKGVKASLDSMPDGVKVKINHFSGFDGIVGSLRDARISGDRVRADLHLLSEHPARDLILELAAKQPSTFGLSIAFSGTKEKKDKRYYARCTELYSVDLVDSPAANPTGLFSQRFDFKPYTKAMLDEIKELLGFAKKADSTLAKLDALAEKLTVLEAANKDLQVKLSTAENKLGEASKTIMTLEAKTTEAEKKAADEKVKLEAEAKKIAAAKALEITAGQGQPPIGSTAGTASGGGDVLAQYNAIQDPREKMEFYRKNKAAYDAQWAAAQKK